MDALFHSSQNGLNHGCYQGGPWILSSQNRLDRGGHHSCAMGTLFSERMRPWTRSWLGHGCCLPLFSEQIRPRTPSWLGHECSFRERLELKQRKLGKIETVKNQGIRDQKNLYNRAKSAAPETRVLDTKQTQNSQAKIDIRSRSRRHQKNSREKAHCRAKQTRKQSDKAPKRGSRRQATV